MIQRARDFAIQHHGDQKYGDQPYSFHLDWVVSLLEPYGETAQVIGYLHDVVEDTHITVADIEATFNEFIANAVAVVSDQPGATREEKKAKTYALMAEVQGDLEIALVVKTADRLANVLASVKFNRDDKLAMYQEEHAQFHAAAYRPGLCDELWTQLNQLINHS